LIRVSIGIVLAASAAFADEPVSQPAPADEAEPGLSATVRGERSVLTEPQSISVVERSDLQRSEGLFLDDVLNLTPGVRYESRTVSGGQRITIRGYGNGTNFNGSAYKAYLNGIPLTDAEGTTILDDLDVSTLGKIEVIKGPASSLYGSGIGGVVRFNTIVPEARKTQVSQELTGGTLNLFRSNTRAEIASDNSWFLANYGHQHSDGDRVHTLSNKDYALLSGEYRPSARQGISFIASFNHSFDQLAGQLNEQQFLNRLDFAEPEYLSNNGHVAIDSVRLGVAHRYQFVPAFGNTTSAFASGYQLDQPFAVGLSDNLALNLGGRTELTGRFDAGIATIRAIVGSEIERSMAFKKSYGLVQSKVGALRGDLQVISLQSNTFAQADVELPAEVTVTAGASLNFVHYNISDRLTAAGHLDQSGVKSFDPVVTPRVAVQKTFARDLSIYAEVSQGYSAPASGSVVIPQIGQVNDGLRPERGTLFEIGSKGLLAGERFGYEIALFDLRVTDKLTTQTVLTPAGSVFYVMTTNAGNQNNIGLELDTRYAVLKNANAPISLVQAFAGYAYSHFRYDGFKSDNNNNATTISYDGNKVVGVPEHVVDAGVDVLSRIGVYGNSTLQVVSPVALTFDNAHSAKRYALLNAKAGYRRDLPGAFKLDVSFGVKNITNSTYYTMVFLNQSYAGPPPQVYLPGPGTTVFGGVNVTKAF